MAVSASIGGISDAERAAIVAEVLSQVTGGGIPDVAGTPPNPAEGDIWRDTSQVPPRLMVWKDGQAREVDAEETLTTDAFGNLINID